jgi:K+-transporting ATPase ATPase C chain
MLLSLRQVTVVLFAFFILCGGIYPLVVTGIATFIFPLQIEGSFIKDEKGKILGSKLIGQHFSDPKYFWGRLSATSPIPYNAAASGGSNLSNGSSQLLDIVKKRITALKEADPENTLQIPVDLVTASASGLDPHISIAAANYQAKRIAKLRGISIDKVYELIDKYSEGRIMGILGEPVVNVLELNLALDGKI